MLTQRAALSTSDWGVFALLGEGPAHGFRLAAAFAKGGELGVVWTVQRPQVYRALSRLETLKFAEVARHELGGGPPRLLYRLTMTGQAALEGWLFTPVEHLREGRSELLLKVVFLERSGRDAAPLLRAQQQRFAEILTRYRARLALATGAEATALEWRTEVARAGLAFLDRQLERRRASG